MELVIHTAKMSLDCSVGIAMRYGLDGWSSIPEEAKKCICTKRPTQPLIQWVPGAVSPGVKRAGGETDHSPPSSAEATTHSQPRLYPIHTNTHTVLLFRLLKNAT
jgi:hypothetical protein